jgi:riboflavin kinase/FMN adenylyltransferase
MRLYRWPRDPKPQPFPRVAAVGGFDGFHRGHQRVIATVCETAHQRGWQACLLTFEPLPAQVFNSQPPHTLRLTTFAERLWMLQRLCVDEVCVLDFSRPEVRALPAAEFMRRVLKEWLDVQVLCGSVTHRLGSDRASWPQIRALASELDIEVLAVPLETVGGERPSSTRIRTLIWAGQLGAAAGLLGRHYTARGVVTTGLGVGRELGFPTLNVQVPADKLLPPDGVYAAWVAGETLGSGPLDAGLFGPAWPAAVNLGTAPTLPTPRPRGLEAHLIGWQGEAGGSEVTVGFVARLRAERRFPDLAGLRRQIADDVEQAARLLAEHLPACAPSQPS